MGGDEFIERYAEGCLRKLRLSFPQEFDILPHR